MIIETTFIGDDGKPFIMDDCECTLVIEDNDGINRLVLKGDVKGNKVIHYWEMQNEKEIKDAYKRIGGKV